MIAVFLNKLFLKNILKYMIYLNSDGSYNKKILYIK